MLPSAWNVASLDIMPAYVLLLSRVQCRDRRPIWVQSVFPYMLAFCGELPLCFRLSFYNPPMGEQPEERRNQKERDALTWLDCFCWCSLWASCF